MKRINKIFSIFIIILLIIFFTLPNAVLAVEIDPHRYNPAELGNSTDKAAENAISDASEIKSAEEFKKAHVAASSDQVIATTAGNMATTIKESSYYQIYNAIVSNAATKDGYGNKYSFDDYMELEEYKKMTYKKISKKFSELSNIEEKDSNKKVDWEIVKKAWDLVAKLEGWKATINREYTITNTDTSELKEYDWIKVMKNYGTAPQLVEQGKLSVVKKWYETLQEVIDDPIGNNIKDSGYTLEAVKSAANYLKEIIDKAEESTTVYKLPLKTSQAESSEASIDDVINDADAFVNAGNANNAYSQTDLQNFSKTIYNILLAAGIIVATAMGGILGIKLMVASAEEKAEVKKLLVPYVIGCVVVFGGFGIWKLVITILAKV